MDETETTPWESQLSAALNGEPEVWTDDCLPPETMIALAERAVPEKKATALMAHVSLCARCRREYAETCELVQLSGEVRALEAAAAPPWWKRWRQSVFGAGWRSPGFGLAVGAGLCAALYAGLVVPVRRESGRLAAAVQERDSRLAAAELQRTALGDELDRLKKRQAETARLADEVKGLKARVGAQQAQVAQLESVRSALEQVSLPPAEWALARDSAAVRGTDDPATAELSLASPVQTALRERQPVLECKAAPGASGYAAHLEVDGSEGETPALRPLGPTRWKVSAPLRPGTVYRWYVTAQRGGKTVGAAPTRFYVLGDTERREVERGRVALAKNPLALGALYARVGLNADAAAQFEAALRTDPKATVARRWLQQLRARK